MVWSRMIQLVLGCSCWRRCGACVLDGGAHRPALCVYVCMYVLVQGVSSDRLVGARLAGWQIDLHEPGHPISGHKI